MVLLLPDHFGLQDRLVKVLVKLFSAFPVVSEGVHFHVTWKVATLPVYFEDLVFLVIIDEIVVA